MNNNKSVLNKKIDNNSDVSVETDENINDSVESTASEKEKKSSFQPNLSILEMLQAGVHFGHKTSRWNIKMTPYIYGVKNGAHIIDLAQTYILLMEASAILREVVKKNGKILFVCTKKQGSEIVKKVASDCGQYYVTNKWLGGMLTNWRTVSKSIKTLKNLEFELSVENSTLTKKEKLLLDRKREKLENQLGGIRNMNGLPNLIFVIDTVRESIAISEAKSLGIPVMAIVDTNSNPDNINYLIPGNDDSIKAIDLYMRVINESLQDVLSNIKDNSTSLEVRDFVKKGNKKNLVSKKASKSIDKSKKNFRKNNFSKDKKDLTNNLDAKKESNNDLKEDNVNPENNNNN